MLWFLLGVGVGVFGGMFGMALLMGGAQADREMSAEAMKYWVLKGDRERG